MFFKSLSSYNQILCLFFSWVHLDAGQYWTQRAAELTGTSHKQVFNDNMDKIYNGLLWNALNHQRKVVKK